jgi:hypothetical protein
MSILKKIPECQTTEDIVDNVTKKNHGDKMRTLNVDSQVINTIQLCARRCQYAFLESLTLPEKAEPLERGDLMHKMMECYYGLKGNCLRKDSEVYKALGETVTSVFLPMDHSAIVPVCLTIGEYFGSRLSLPLDEVEQCLYQFKEYAEYYKHEDWNPLQVEAVGSEILYQDDDYRFIYSVKIDAIMEQGNMKAPWDHKTSKKRSPPISLSNQFLGYCWALGTNNIVVNKIGFQKTLKPNERFERHILEYTNAQIQEWRANTIQWCYYLIEHLETNHWPQNFTSCDKYSGCIYAQLCSADPQIRDLIKAREYKVTDEWDVAKILKRDQNAEREIGSRT